MMSSSTSGTLIGGLGLVKTEVAPDHPVVPTVLSHLKSLTSATADRPVLVDGLQVHAMPAFFALALDEEVQATDRNEKLVSEPD